MRLIDIGSDLHKYFPLKTVTKIGLLIFSMNGANLRNRVIIIH